MSAVQSCECNLIKLSGLAVFDILCVSDAEICPCYIGRVCDVFSVVIIAVSG